MSGHVRPEHVVFNSPLVEGRLALSAAYVYLRESDRVPPTPRSPSEKRRNVFTPRPEPVARVKLFLPGTGWTWWIAEYDPETCEAFGLVEGEEVELGYFNLAEIAAVPGACGLPVERDLWWHPRPLQELADERRAKFYERR